MGLGQPPRRPAPAGRPGLPEPDPKVLAWFNDLAKGRPRKINPLDARTDLVEALAAHGYKPQNEAPFCAYQACDLVDLFAPELPSGYTARAVCDESDLPRRAAVGGAGCVLRWAWLCCPGGVWWG